MNLITIIPTYNEEHYIKDVIDIAKQYSDVLVVDDGSKDNTAEIADRSGSIIIKHDKNMGKGAAIKTGIKYALKHDYEILMLIDGDGQHDPNHIPLLSSQINTNEIVIGSRFKETTPLNMPIQRKLSNKITTNLIKYVTGYKLTDSQSGFRAIPSDIAKLFLDIKYDDYVYESEMLYMASKHNIEIKEVAIPCVYGKEKSHISQIHVFRYVLFVMRILGRKLKIRAVNSSIGIKKFINNI